MSSTISYKNNTIATINNGGTKTLQTSGKYLEANVVITDTTPSGASEGFVWKDTENYLHLSNQTGTSITVEPLNVTENGTYTAQNRHSYSPVTVDVPSTGVQSQPVKLINFIDYDGTVLYSYTASEFSEVVALPANPTHHSNLIPQGWNRTLAQIQAHVSAFPHVRIDIGQIYRTIDGKTHLHIYYDTANNLLGKEHYFLYTQTVSYGVEIDWGDGSEIETHSTTGSRIECIHNYSEPGEYEVTFNVVSGTMSFQCSSGSCIIGSTYYPDRGWNRSTVQAIEIGDNVTAIGNYAFAYCQQMETITISPDVTSIGTEAFDNMYSLRAIVLPNSVTSIGQYAFWLCPSIKFISLPYSMSSWSDYIFQDCQNIPSIIVPNGITNIAQYTFDACRTMHTIVIPSSVTSIAAYAFRNATGVAEYHFQSTNPPTLANTNAFYSIQSFTKIYVPKGKVNAYKTATNWSTYASQIYEEPI